MPDDTPWWEQIGWEELQKAYEEVQKGTPDHQIPCELEDLLGKAVPEEE